MSAKAKHKRIKKKAKCCACKELAAQRCVRCGKSLCDQVSCRVVIDGKVYCDSCRSYHYKRK